MNGWGAHLESLCFLPIKRSPVDYLNIFVFVSDHIGHFWGSTFALISKMLRVDWILLNYSPLISRELKFGERGDVWYVYACSIYPSHQSTDIQTHLAHTNWNLSIEWATNWHSTRNCYFVWHLWKTSTLSTNRQNRQHIRQVISRSSRANIRRNLEDGWV